MVLTVITRRFGFRGTHALEVGEHREKRHGHHYFFEVSAVPAECARAFELGTELAARMDARDLTKLLDPTTGETLVEYLAAEFAAREIFLFSLALQETRKNRFFSAASSEQAL